LARTLEGWKFDEDDEPPRVPCDSWSSGSGIQCEQKLIPTLVKKNSITKSKVGVGYPSYSINIEHHQND